MEEFEEEFQQLEDSNKVVRRKGLEQLHKRLEEVVREEEGRERLQAAAVRALQDKWGWWLRLYDM